MKLRNKKTGEIVEYDNIFFYKLTCKGNEKFMPNAQTISELNEDWEDYKEEPLKPYWHINDLNGTPMYCDVSLCKDSFRDWAEQRKQIGNYFETKEQAEKAVEKLKAWKRLKDKGFRFKCCDDYHIDYEVTGKCVWTDENEADLDLLFGGEE